MNRAIATLILGVFSAAGLAHGAAVDIQPPEVRRQVLERAEALAHGTAPAPLPADLPTPFAPPSFAAPAPKARNEARNDVPAAPATDREVLEAVADKIPTTGTIILGGKPLLVSGMNRIEVGSRFTVVYNGQEYELELTAIDRTTFTVRYKGEEFTRPIKLAKTP